MDENTEELFFESPYLVTFFNFFWYFAFIPFKTVLNRSGEYVLKTNKIHQVICGIAHAGTFVFINHVTLVGVSKIRSSSDTLSIIGILDCASNIGSTLSIMVLLYALWKRRDLCRQVFEVTRCKFESKRKLQVIRTLVCLGSFFLVIFFWSIGWILVSEHYSYGHIEFSSNGEMLVNVLKEIDGREEETENKNININITNSDWTMEGVNNDSFPRTDCSINSSNYKTFLGILQYCVYMYLSIFYVVSQAIFFVLVVTLKEMGKQFSTDILHHCMGDDGIDKGIKIYRKLKGAVDLIRSIYGDAMLGFYISAVAYYAETPHVLMGRRGETEKLVLLYFTISSVMWLIAAEFNSMAKITISKWIEFHSDSKDTTHDNRLRLHTISGEVTAHALALSNKCFSVTYAHLGSMLSLVVTYGLIVFQVHQSEKH